MTIFLLIDTCFCIHCEELQTFSIFDMRPLLYTYNLGITEAGKKELINFDLQKYLALENCLIIPITKRQTADSIRKNEFLKEMDEEDQTLWIAGFYHEGYIILTDDGELVENCQISEIPALRLPDFQLLLVREGEMVKNDVSKCLKFWEKRNRYSKKELKRWKEELRQI